MGLAMGVPVGRLLGYEPVYVPAEEPGWLDNAHPEQVSCETL
jgi:hypothetical protein